MTAQDYVIIISAIFVGLTSLAAAIFSGLNNLRSGRNTTKIDDNTRVTRQQGTEIKRQVEKLDEAVNGRMTVALKTAADEAYARGKLEATEQNKDVIAHVAADAATTAVKAVQHQPEPGSAAVPRAAPQPEP